MNRVELYTKDGRYVGVDVCTDCKILMPTQGPMKRDTCNCPHICPQCGVNECKPHQTICSDCRNKNWATERAYKEAKALLKAKQVTAAETTDMTYSEDYPWHEGYMSSWQDDIVDIEDDPDYGPIKYVWNCRKEFIFDRVNLENMMDLCYDDAYEDWSHDGKGGEALEAAIKKFKETNDLSHNYVWWSETKEVHIIDPSCLDDALETIGEFTDYKGWSHEDDIGIATMLIDHEA